MSSQATVLALSPEPQPFDNDFLLWDLRTEAAYERIHDPFSLGLYELNALVDYPALAAGIDDYEVVEPFFMDDYKGPNEFPSCLDRVNAVPTRDSHENEQLYHVTVVYLGTEDDHDAQRLYDTLLSRARVVAYDPTMENIGKQGDSHLVGPLRVRDAMLNINGLGDG